MLENVFSFSPRNTTVSWVSLISCYIMSEYLNLFGKKILVYSIFQPSNRYIYIWGASIIDIRRFCFDGIVEWVDLAFRSDSVDLISFRLLFMSSLNSISVVVFNLTSFFTPHGFSAIIAKPEDTFSGHVCQSFRWNFCTSVVYPATTFVTSNGICSFISCWRAMRTCWISTTTGLLCPCHVSYTIYETI